MARKKKTQEEIAEENAIYERLNRIRLYPGSIKEYEDFCGYPVEIIDTGIRDMRIRYKRKGHEAIEYLSSFRVLKKVTDEKIIALVRVPNSRSQHPLQDIDSVVHGIPVKKRLVKKKK